VGVVEVGVEVVSMGASMVMSLLLAMGFGTPSNLSPLLPFLYVFSPPPLRLEGVRVWK
jgi:hypothetical protein